MSTPSRSTASEATPVSRKLVYGFAAVGDMIGFHGPLNLAVPIYTLYLGVNPALVGAAVAITRIWDAVSDPIMGQISDRCKSPMGRRRPFIIWGALTGGLIFALMWQIPTGLTQVGYTLFLTATLMLFYTAFTVFTVPYHALGYEMSSDYHERTSIMTYRMVFNVVGNVSVGWLFATAKAPIFGDALTGAKWAGGLVGLLFALTCMLPGFFIRERPVPPSMNTEPFWRSFVATAKLVQFRVLLILTALILITSSLIFSSFLIFINTFYTFGGDVGKAAVLQGLTTTCFAISNAVALPLMARLSVRIGKKTTLYWAFSIQAIAGAATWFMIRPDIPYLQLVVLIVHQVGFVTFFLMLHSMTADVCELDEHKSGQRREGMFGAAITWVQKMAVALSVMFSGSILVALGFDHSPGASQPESVVTGMRLAFTGVLVLQALISLWVLGFYKLDEVEVARIRAQKLSRAAVA